MNEERPQKFSRWRRWLLNPLYITGVFRSDVTVAATCPMLMWHKISRVCPSCPQTGELQSGRKRRRRQRSRLLLAMGRPLNASIVAIALAAPSPLLCSSAGAPCSGLQSLASSVPVFLCCWVERLSSIGACFYFLRSGRHFSDL